MPQHKLPEQERKTALGRSRPAPAQKSPTKTNIRCPPKASAGNRVAAQSQPATPRRLPDSTLGKQRETATLREERVPKLQTEDARNTEGSGCGTLSRAASPEARCRRDVLHFRRARCVRLRT